MAVHHTRREFLKGLAKAASALTVAVAVTACPPNVPPKGNGVVVWKRRHRGRRVSKAEKLHNANHLYRTFADALNDLPHPGAHSKVVPVTISQEKFNQLFFHQGICCVDLRTV
jgi:hypothetical protein